MTDYEHNPLPKAPWELKRQTEGHSRDGYSMVSMRLTKALATRINIITNHLGTNRSQFMRHAIVTFLTIEENKLKEPAKE